MVTFPTSSQFVALISGKIIQWPIIYVKKTGADHIGLHSCNLLGVCRT